MSKDAVGSMDTAIAVEGVHGLIGASSDSLYVDGALIHQPILEAKSRYSFSGIRDSRRIVFHGAGTTENTGAGDDHLILFYI